MFILIINKQKQLKVMTATHYHSINLIKLNVFLQQFAKTQTSRMDIKLLIKNLQIDIKDISLHEILMLGIQVQQRSKNFYKKQRRQQHFSRWIHGQQKLFHFIIPYFFSLHKLSLQSLKEADLRPLQSIFVSKSLIQLYFQVKYLDSLTNNFKISWNQQDCKNLTEIVIQYQAQIQSFTKWKKISLKVLVMSNGLNFHSPRDCRQMWANHLNPKISKESWDLKQDYELFSLIKEFGCKWSLVSKKMKKNRTEHMVKNRVNSFLRKYKYKAKHPSSAQIEQIMGDLYKKIIQQQEKQKFQQTNIQTMTKQIQGQQYQFKQFATFKQDNTIEVIPLIQKIDEFFDLTPERIIIAPPEIQDVWQYNQEASVNQFNFYGNVGQHYSNSIFDQLILPKSSLSCGIFQN